ncbi:hypothetical protein OU415_19520 [Saccharopolyspora sp. WRP15-2]|uniref:Ada DNA repair metal-binding domain-containing protein n=1 Tax=Saccharopolyspora oryzae TaxID=2997343 RepID=A0ABT4V0Z9_9PSEU|nr:hypothetical protein [Saccharopolyspora oryzae]MDA3627638.1 hypothetical protein [Saccharopolyspora oryzae]
MLSRRTGERHDCKRSNWDRRAFSLCGKTFAANTIQKELLVYGGVTCKDCKAAKKAGKTL